MHVKHFWSPPIATVAIPSHPTMHLVDPVDMVLLDLIIGHFCLAWNHKQALTWECYNRWKILHEKKFKTLFFKARNQLQPVWDVQESKTSSECVETYNQMSQDDSDVVERYIAVPISATEQYLISSTGQTYLTEKLPSPIKESTQISGININKPIWLISRV